LSRDNSTATAAKTPCVAGFPRIRAPRASSARIGRRNEKV
jgi:hypothetical protein